MSKFGQATLTQSLKYQNKNTGKKKKFSKFIRIWILTNNPFGNFRIIQMEK